MVWNRNAVRERVCLPCFPFQGSHCVPSYKFGKSHLFGGGGGREQAAWMAHLGKVVLFFSQGLRTGSGGKATNQEDQGHGVPPPSPPPPPPRPEPISPCSRNPLFKEPS